LAIACFDGSVHLLDPATGTIRGMIDVPGDGVKCLAFIPDGRTLATGGYDTTILLWDVKHVLKTWQSRLRKVASADLETLWQRLASANGTEAAEAMAQLQTMPRQTVALLRQQLRPVSPLDVRAVGRLLDDLGSEEFEVRQRATSELEKLGPLVESLLRKRLAAAPALEVRRRLEMLLEALDSFASQPEQMRADRAVEVLEHVGSAEARALLRELAGGATEAPLTRQAKASLKRLENRP
jgi:hypothetical protein